ncbi:MAG: sigma-70 family RNA polymerase sigma factor [Coriobacteriales bacterium]|nr:sigma-70 family RNA polymerase sigma factor [Coriobacteriales bacterium]
MAERTSELRSILARTRSDASLFSRALRGDPIAFSEIYRRYHPRVYAFCLSRLLDPALAEDAAQETFVRFLHADPATVDNARSWLFGVARNVSIDIIRQRKRVLTTDVDDDSMTETAADSGEELLRREQGRSIMLAMRRLRPRYRTALVLRELHGMSSAEIAVALETTPGAVDTLVNRARDAFGRMYAEVCDLPEECRRAFPLIYKRLGTGLDEPEEARLQAHVETCERCRAEARRASSPSRLTGAVPLLMPLGAAKRGAIGQLLASLDPQLLTIPTVSTPIMQSAGVKMAAAAFAVTAVIAAPVTKGVVDQQKATQQSRVESALVRPLPDVDAKTGVPTSHGTGGSESHGSAKGAASRGSKPSLGAASEHAQGRRADAGSHGKHSSGSGSSAGHSSAGKGGADSSHKSSSSGGHSSDGSSKKGSSAGGSDHGKSDLKPSKSSKGGSSKSHSNGSSGEHGDQRH